MPDQPTSTPVAPAQSLAPPCVPGRLAALLHRDGPMTRAEATSRLGVVRSAMGAAVDELARLGLVRVGEQAHSPLRESAGRGRTSPRLEPAAQAPVAATVSLQPTGTDVALVQFGGADLAHARLAPVTGREPRKALASIAEWIERELRAAGRPCLGVGVGVAGIVSADGRSIVSALYLDWHSVAVADVLGGLLPAGIPVRAHNDGSLIAFAEYHHGAGRNAAALLVLGCEHIGISGAMLTRPQALASSFPAPDHAFELGHLALDPYGPPCPCGQRGCLELYCDGRALNRALGRAETDPPRSAIDAALHADPTARRAVADAANRLGTGLAGLINVLGPDRVVLGGLLADYLRLSGADLTLHLQGSIVARLRGTALKPATVPAPVTVGAAEAVFAGLFTSPADAMRAAAHVK